MAAKAQVAGMVGCPTKHPNVATKAERPMAAKAQVAGVGPRDN
jgi:hypothetical protein